MSKIEFKTCNEQYCNGLGNSCITTSSNCCICLECLKTNGPEPSTNNPTRYSVAANEVCNCLSTVLCFPFKTAILIPSCPFIVFCPNICLSIKETLCKMC